MNSMTGWILAALFFVTTLVMFVLWLFARRNKSAGNDNAAAQNATPRDTSALNAFQPDSEYTLLANGVVNVAGKVKSHGVVVDDSAGSGEPVLFMVEQTMLHLEVGDQFKLHNNEPYKISERSSEALTKPAQTASANDAPTEARAGVESATPAAPKDDQRTVLFSMASAADADPLETFPFFKVIEGPDEGKEFPLHYQDSQIGRGDTNGVALSDEGASRNHCKLGWKSSVFELEDLGSTNGTLCNGAKIQTRTLEFGDRIQVSDTVMVFTCRGFELAESDAERSIAAFQKTLRKQPDFLPALKNLAFLLERDIGRSGEADPLWKQISILEKNA